MPVGGGGVLWISLTMVLFGLGRGTFDGINHAYSLTNVLLYLCVSCSTGHL